MACTAATTTPSTRTCSPSSTANAWPIRVTQMIPHQLFQVERAKGPGRNVMSDARTAPQARYAVPAVLELRGVSKVYGSGPAEVHALRQADLSVEAGSMVAVMGPSGSGESHPPTLAGHPRGPHHR